MQTTYKDTRWFAWCQLIRLPNVFTVVADVLAGVAVAQACWLPWPLVAVLVVATMFLYWSGMILNDVNDVEQDRVQNRGRPLVDGRISLQSARFAGYGMILVSLSLVIAIVGFTVSSHRSSGANAWGSLATIVVAFVLAAAVIAYNSWLKATVFGPWLMGLCRVGSMLMGLSVGWWLDPTESWWSPHYWMLAVGNGVYISGITWAARREAEEYRGWLIPFGWSLSLLGIAMLAAVPVLAPTFWKPRIEPTLMYPIAIGLVALPWARRAFVSWRSPSPRTIQAAVKQAIFTVIFLDAIVVLQFAGTWPAVAVCSLIFPAITIGKYFRST